MRLFETKKSEKSLHTQSDTAEPLNFHAASIGQPNPVSTEEEKKKVFTTGVTGASKGQAACSRSKVSQTS